jgi:hypothetical protein
VFLHQSSQGFICPLNKNIIDNHIILGYLNA